MKELFEGVYLIDEKLASENLVPGKKVYDEKVTDIEETEFRLWNPTRSKLSAAIFNGLKKLPIKPDSKVLYLGAASGTTASHISDILKEGVVFCVESSSTPMEKLITVCKNRINMIPLLADANRPETYSPLLEKVDVIYQDIAQKNQAEILLKNSKFYLKECGHVMIAIKARSIDSTRKVEDVTSAELAKLKSDFKIEEVVDLAPYEKDHVLATCKKK